MPVCAKLSVLDLLKMHIPRCPGCVCPVPAIACSGPQADADLLDILTFAGVIPEGNPVAPSQASSGTLLGKVDSGVEHLASFLQSQTSTQQHESPVLTPTPSHDSQVHPQLPTGVTLPHSPSTQRLSGVLSPKQIAPVTPSTQRSILPAAHQHQSSGPAFRPAPTTPKASPLPSHHKTNHASSPLTANVELELHPSPSLFFKETRGETLKPTEQHQVSVDIKTQVSEANSDLQKPQSKVDLQNPQTKVDLQNPQTKVDLQNPQTKVDLQNPQTKVDLQNPQTKVDLQNPQTKVDLQNPQSKVDLSKPQSKVDSAPSKGQGQGSGSGHSHQVKDSDTCPKKAQEAHLLNSHENRASNDKARQGKKEKADLDPSINKTSKGHHRRLGSGSGKVGGLSKGQAKDSKLQEARPGHSSSKVAKSDSGPKKGDQTKAVSTGKDHAKGDSGPKKGDQTKVVSTGNDHTKSDSGPKKGDQSKAVSTGNDHTKSDSGPKKGDQSKAVSTGKEQQCRDVPRAMRGQDKTYELPFVSTDEQENRDNEDPRWKKQAVLRTNQERYRVAHRLWRSPCVPDPNTNLTVFGTSHLAAQHSQGSAGRHPRKRWREMDEEFQPPRKRQRRFENVQFNVEQIKRSKIVVMNEFLKTLVTPHITRQVAKKLENSHQEKQYMLDLACEEVTAIQMFYDGLPDQDLTVTQEEVERGSQATEHVYQVFGDVYGYWGQEFFP
ncbi:uncharacterized protein LOC126988914 isoform X8 [Eriocheir sinensis]|uniref:uncharacterized protein LOC126988914 isoform X8 n=1 Tax=Eriocheir sinensis TaxID=95602 RepID=UPI0021C5D139|nr:uncharacterized protein LOC126988914 isoform X8 [Eriocheir sinensis]